MSHKNKLVEPENTNENEIDDDLQTTTQTPLRRERTKPYQRRNHVSAPYQARENLAASIGRQKTAPYQRRQQITEPYKEIENPLKIRSNSGKIF